jgi:hypothetical protein
MVDVQQLGMFEGCVRMIFGYRVLSNVCPLLQDIVITQSLGSNCGWGIRHHKTSRAGRAQQWGPELYGLETA